MNLPLLHPFQRDASPLGYHVQDIVVVDHHLLLLAAQFPGGENRFQLLLRLLLLIPHGSGVLEILVLDRFLFLEFDLIDLAFQCLDVRRPGHGLDPGARAGLVHEIDGLVGQIAPGDVAVGQLDGSLQGRIGQRDVVMLLVFDFDSLENLYGVLDRRSFHVDGLKPAFQGSVLLDVLPVFVHRGRPDALQLAPAQGGFDDVGGVHGAFSGTGADDGVQFVDEQNDILGAANLLHHRLDADFELPPVFGSGHHQGQIQGDDPFVPQNFRNVAAGDFLGQSLDDGRFPDPGFAQQNGIVFGAPAQNLGDPFDLFLAADDRIHFPLFGDIRQIPAEGPQGGRTSLSLLFAEFFFDIGIAQIVARLRVGIEFLENLFAGMLDIDIQRPQDLGRQPVAFPQQPQQDMFGADVGMFEAFSFLPGESQHLLGPRGIGAVVDDLVALSLVHVLAYFLANRVGIQTHSPEDVNRDSLPQLDQAEQQVLSAHVTMVKAIRFLSRQR